jgi:hypothetical protein
VTEAGRLIHSRAAPLWLAVMAVLGALVYAPGLDIPYYSDDFHYLLPDPHASWRERFTERNEGTGFFRPVEALVLGPIQGRVGTEPRPVHVVVLASHVLLAWMVWFAARRFGAPTPAGELGSAFFLVWQTNAMAVLSNDTLSQVLSTALGCAAALMLWAALDQPPGHRRGPRALIGALGILAFTAALFTKETAVGFLPVMLFLLAAPAGARRPIGRVLAGLAIALGVALYFHLRATAAGAEMPTVGEGRYQFRLAENVPVNAAKFALSVVLPTSSIGVVDALRDRRWLAVAATALATLAFVVAVIAGIRRARRGRLALTLLLLAVFALSPMLLLNHVSELYTYGATPFLAVIVGMAGAVFLRAPGARTRIVTVAATFALLFGHVAAVRVKAVMMDANGRAAERLLGELEPHVRALAPGATLWLVLPPRPPSYSVFRVDGFEVLRGAETSLERRAGRPDARVRLVPEPGPWHTLRGPNDRELRLRDGALVP